MNRVDAWPRLYGVRFHSNLDLELGLILWQVSSKDNEIDMVITPRRLVAPARETLGRIVRGESSWKILDPR